MRETTSRPGQLEPAIRYSDDLPNLPEVSGTSFSLLTTVLTGFAVTIVVQLLFQGGGSDLTGRAILAIGALLLSILALIASTVCTINAQARNYLSFLDLNDESRELLNIRDVRQWVRCLERQWYVYQWASLYAFYSGLALLLMGINLIVWIYAGTMLAALFLAAVVVSLVISLGLGFYVERMGLGARASLETTATIEPEDEDSDNSGDIMNEASSSS